MNNEYRMNKRSYRLAWWTQAIPNFILCVATFLLFLTSWHSVNERKKEREEMMRPYVAVSICKGGQKYFLKIANLGGGPAYDVKVFCKVDFIKSFLREMFCQKEELFAYIGDESKFTDKQGIVQVDIKYKDVFGNQYKDRLDLRLDKAGFDKEVNLLFAIEQIGEKLDNISK